MERYKSTGHVLGYLRLDEHFIKEQADIALSQSQNLPTASAERDWINILVSCAADIRAATKVAASVEEREKVLTVPDRLARIFPAATDINKKLVEAAKGVRLDNIAEAIRLVEQHLGETMDEPPPTGIKQGAIAISRLRSRLGGLVAEHDEWQSLDKEIELANSSTKHQPQARFANWGKFKRKLLGLCNTFPQEKWSIELKRIMEPWMGDETPPEPRIRDNIERLDDDFMEFYHMCVQRFIKVDKELYELCDKLTQFKDPLEAFVESARCP